MKSGSSGSRMREQGWKRLLTAKGWRRSRSGSAGQQDACYRDWIAQATEVCEQAARGDFEARLLGASEAPPDLETLALAINNLLDRTDAFVREAGASLEHTSQGKYFRRVL